MYNKDVFIVGNEEKTMYLFRGELIKDISNRNFNVYALYPFYSQKIHDKIVGLGARPINTPMDRVGISPFKDIKYCLDLIKKIRSINPSVVLTYFVKPNIYGMIAAKICGVETKIALVEGMGHLFIEEESKSISKSIVRYIVIQLYKISLGLASTVFVLNKDDKKLLLKNNIVNKGKLKVLGGIGVDITRFKPKDAIVEFDFDFVFVGRMLKEKGIRELILATKILKEKNLNLEVALVGDVDENPSSLEASELEEYSNDSNSGINWLGYVDSVEDVIQKSKVFILPSYREGLPRSTQEAMAMGKPIITTDVPGCRDTVIEGLNGFIVPHKNSEMLAVAMEKFIVNKILVNQMGKESRKLAEEKFNVKEINNVLMSSMGLGS